ncbi:hypothetical protein H6B07_09410 [Mediterraneibacter glycyrrhizinilyticus]|nr:hypothetical protein [Mediterraneibacter glycyrrhizinilyticus]MBM6802872.1 hypothetical protein [Mediterraneibacter glycyrrhizinilyticus]
MKFEHNAVMIGSARFLEEQLRKKEISYDRLLIVEEITGCDSEFCGMAVDFLDSYCISDQKEELDELFCGLTGQRIGDFLERWIQILLIKWQECVREPMELCLNGKHFILIGKCTEEEKRILFPSGRRAEKLTVAWEKQGEETYLTYLQEIFLCRENLRLYLGAEKGLIPGGTERRKRYAGKYPVARQSA